MTREEAKEWLPIIQAWAEGKPIQYQIDSRWIDITKDIYTSNRPYNYHIKSEIKYRPFKDKEECWEEMQKHQPFGWVKYHCDFFQIIHVDYNSIGYGSACGTILHSKFEDIFKDSTFADGTPFGMKEE